MYGGTNKLEKLEKNESDEVYNVIIIIIVIIIKKLFRNPSLFYKHSMRQKILIWRKKFDKIINYIIKTNKID